MTAKEALIKNIPKDCIWEDMDNLTNCPIKHVLKAMESYAEQQAIEFAEFIRTDLQVHTNYKKGAKGYVIGNKEYTPPELYKQFQTENR